MKSVLADLRAAARRLLAARSFTRVEQRDNRVVLVFLPDCGIVRAPLALSTHVSRGLRRVLESQLFGVHPAEPHLLLAAGIAFGLCGLAAIWWPARRAASVDPALLLKDD